MRVMDNDNNDIEIFVKIVKMARELDDPDLCELLAGHLKFEAINIRKQKEHNKEEDKRCQSLNL